MCGKGSLPHVVLGTLVCAVGEAVAAGVVVDFVSLLEVALLHVVEVVSQEFVPECERVLGLGVGGGPLDLLP